MLQVDKLHQYYGGSHILRGLTFDVKVGEVTCLLGRNGVGKTTLLNCLAAAIPGSIRRGQVASCPSRNSRLISRPTSRKNTAISASLIQCSTDNGPR